jgi:hypothetical protein
MSLDRVEAEITRLRMELAELETTRAVLLRLGAPDAPAPAQTTTVRHDCEGLKILDCCKLILDERGEEGAHFYDVADEALRRGYCGYRDSSQDSIRRSFFDCLRRNRDDFRLLGNGIYRLAQTASEEIEEMAAGIASSAGHRPVEN